MKEKIKKEVLRRIRLILKTELNSKNRITAINTLALPVATYSFNIIDWNLNDIKRMEEYDMGRNTKGPVECNVQTN